jgi:hypothetical protein
MLKLAIYGSSKGKGVGRWVCVNEKWKYELEDEDAPQSGRNNGKGSGRCLKLGASWTDYGTRGFRQLVFAIIRKRTSYHDCFLLSTFRRA